MKHYQGFYNNVDISKLYSKQFNMTIRTAHNTRLVYKRVCSIKTQPDAEPKTISSFYILQFAAAQKSNNIENVNIRNCHLGHILFRIMNAALAVAFINAIRSHLNQYSTHVHDSRDDSCVLLTKNEFCITSKRCRKKNRSPIKVAGPT